MGGCPTEQSSESCSLMENLTSHEHSIEIPRRAESTHIFSGDRNFNGIVSSSNEQRFPNLVRTLPASASPPSNSTRNSPLGRRTETRRRRSPLNSGLWISVELVITLIQITASIVVLAVAKHEKPHSPLRAWIVGYASGCCATLPLLYWRYYHRNTVSDPESIQYRQGSTHINVPAGPFSVSVSRASEGDDRRTPTATSRSSQVSNAMNSRLKAMVEYIKMGLDCYFAIWFVVGNVWIFGGHGSSNDAPNLYRLCIVFLAFSCIGYAMPFILCATFCCCLPCIVSILGLREDLANARGATSDMINSLPTYKFKSHRNRTNNDRDEDAAAEGGVLAVGTERERMISGEDAICSICLAKYAHNEEVKELPCAHFFHRECVEKWLKINATCPLCKSEVGQ